MKSSGILAPAASPGEAWQVPAPLRFYSWFVCLFILALIFLGGQVKSHEAGLSVPDWPLTYNQNPITYPVSQWKGGIFHEHLHRLVAGTAGCLTLVLCIALFFVRVPRWLRYLGVATVVAVVAQAILGGMTVWYQLPVLVSSSHATLAQTYLLLNVIIAYSLSVEHRERRTGELPALPGNAAFKRAVILIALIYMQLMLGAIMRHTESGLAIPDFPTTAGAWVPSFSEDRVAWVNDWRFTRSMETGIDLPPVNAHQMYIHFAHRMGAVVVTTYILWLAWWLSRHKKAYPLSAETIPWVGGLVLVQFILGASVIWTARIPMITSFHVVTGAALMALATLLALRSYPGRATQPEGAPGTAGAAATSGALAS